MSSRTDLFPPIEPHLTGRLAVSPRHTLYWEQCGNSRGIPVVFLHGGPGAGASPTHRRFFDPTAWQIVIFDQRGAGRSTPLGETRENDLPALVADLEALRLHLGIARWVIFGGSWGSTLGLAYAEAHPQRCLALVLRGIFLCRQSEIDWFVDGLRRFQPEAWRAFAETIPPADRGDLLAAYHDRLMNPDPAIHFPAARSWTSYEANCSTLLPRNDMMTGSSTDRLALGMARIEAHFMRFHAIPPERDLLGAIGRIRPIPGTIIHGRYDILCPIDSADSLARAWPEARYVVVPDAGHSALEHGILAALLATTERLKNDLQDAMP